MQRLNDIQFCLDEQVSDGHIQTVIDDRLYDELLHRSRAGNVVYVALYCWALYATSLLEHSPAITLLVGVTIASASVMRVLLCFQMLDKFISLALRKLSFSVCTLLISMAWSALAINVLVFSLNAGVLHQDVLMIAILIFSIVGGAVNVLAISSTLLQSFIVIMLFPLLCGLIFISTPTALALAGLVFCGLLFSFDVGKRIHHDYRQRLEHEITLEHQSEMLKKARDLALDAVRSKSAFLANMSHEIRTPMNGVLGMSNLLLSTSLSHKQYGFVQAIKRSGDALLLIINDILDFSKIEAGKMELENHSFCYRTVVEDVAEMLFEQGFDKGVEIVIDLPADLPRKLLGDRGRLRQILVNLVSNAVKFTEQGEVLIAVKVHKESAERVGIICAVHDTGIGIASENQRYVFDSFTQADASTTRKFGGTGLGLAICKKLVSMMGGTIHLHSEVGKGSDFSFELAFELVEADHDSTLLYDSLKGMRALIVDDNASCKNIVSEQLMAWGLSCQTLSEAKSVMETVAQAQSAGDSFDVILIDMHILAINAIELGKDIRSAAEAALVPIVMLTSCSLDEDEVMASDVGFDGFVSKPLRQSQLYQALYHAVQNKHLNRTVRYIQPKRVMLERLDACVLLAEDNDINQAVAKELLEAFGCRVRLAADGQQAIQLYLDGGIDLILMDCQMPVLDGYHACRSIRDLEKTTASVQSARLPVVALTAHAMAGDKELCLAAGMDDYLSKPFSREQLFEMLSLYLPKHCKQKTCAAEPVAELESENVHLAVIDAEVICLLPGGAVMLQKVLKMFIKSSGKFMLSMQHGIEVNDAKQVMQAAHTLKSSSAMLGAMALAKLCDDIEKITRSHDMTGVACMVEEAEKAVLLVENEIRSVYLDDDICTV